MFTARLGIRTRILAIALVPSVALFAIGAGTAGYLLRQGEQVKAWASVLEKANLQARDMIDAIQQERSLSLDQLAHPRANPADLDRARGRLDTTLDALVSLEATLASAHIEQMSTVTSGFDAAKAQLPRVRSQIDAGTISLADTDDVYSALLQGLAIGTQLIGNSAPDSDLAFEYANEARVLRATEAMSRSSALAVSALDGAELPAALTTEFRRLVGYYRTELPQLASDLGGERRARAAALISSPAWHQLSAMEGFVLEHEATDKALTDPASATSIADWHKAIDDARAQALGLWQAQNEYANKMTNADATRTARNSLLTGSAALVMALAAFLASLWLANRLIRRFTRLRTETLGLVEERLPDTERRLDHGASLDLAQEVHQLEFGNDELAEVAEAFNQAHAAAIAAAVAEARTREGVRAIFLNIAHRSQLLVHRQLEILDEAERRQEDPVILQTLFELDHLATRERRHAENLVILAGGKANRRWRRPVPLVELVRSAASEALDFKRVRTTSMPPILIIGDAVADLAHLLAELIDNATQYSPPQCPVEVAGTLIGKGVAIEVSDQGIGMSADDFDRANDMLRNPPDFTIGTLSQELRLGLFVVAKLALAHKISVRLNESEHGGVRAIVLVPNMLTATDKTPGTTEPVANHRSEIACPASDHL